MSQFYELDSTKTSLRENWWWTRSWAVVISLLFKLFRHRITASSDDLTTESTLPFLVASLPEEIDSGFQPLADSFSKLGFQDPIYHLVEDPGSRTTVYWATFRHESSQHFARIHQRFWGVAAKSNRGIFPLFFTEFTDGSFDVSSAGKPDMEAPRTVRMNRMFRADVDSLWKSHLARVAQAPSHCEIRPVLNTGDLVDATERHHILVRNFHLARGIFRVRTPEEEAKAAQFSGALNDARASGVENPEVVAELVKLQEQSPTWTNSVWVLAGSILLFVAAGAARGNWKFTLWLVPAIFLHEAGHWIAMRLFKYRNLQMFFIPLFGAAVTGQHWNVPGWKKALVSLAGPLPGILLGALLGILALVLKKPFLNDAALVLLFLNGYNLLPILPLDGGHVLQAILFCRNRWLDLTFRVLAIIGLIGLSFAGMGRMLVYIAVPMAITLPVVFALGKVTDSLRLAPPPDPAPGEDRIPVESANIIIGAIKSVMPKGAGAKVLAQQTLTVFESLNAKPPSAPATILLLLMHGAGIFFVVVFGAFLLVTKQGPLKGFLDSAAMQPEHSFRCGTIRIMPPTAPGQRTSGGPTTLIVNTLSKSSKAVQAFESLGNQLPPGSKLTLLGDSLLLALPAGDDTLREHWFDRFQEFATNTFVALSNNPVSMSLSFIAPTAAGAANMEKELNEFFNVAGTMPLVPPWTPEALKPGFDEYLRARHAWHRMERAGSQVRTNAAVMAFYQKISLATKRGSATDVARLSDAQQKLVERLTTEEKEKLSHDPELKQFPQLVALHDQFAAINFTNRTARAATLNQVAPLLGSYTNAIGDYMSTSGFCFRNGLLVNISWLSMSTPDSRLPELMNWLCEQHCTAIHYNFNGSLQLGGDDDDRE